MKVFKAFSRDKFLRVQLICLSLIGIEEKITLSNRIRFNICFISMLIMDLATVLFALKNISDIALVCDSLAPLFTAYLGIVKQLCLVTHKRELWQIIKHLKNFRDHATTNELEALEKSSKLDQHLATAFLTSALTTGSLFVVAAIGRGLYNLIFNNVSYWPLPLPLSFPFDTSHPIVFVFLFIWSSVAICMVAFASVSSDAAFAGIASNLAVHFECIKLRFADRKFFNGDESLKNLIAYHDSILCLSQKLMISFRIIIFQNLLVASVLLCALGFQLVMFLGSSVMLIYLVYATAIVIQVTFFAYYGSLLFYESTSVADAIYCSNWYEASPKTRQILLQCIMRAQIPVNTRAGFMVASLPTMRAILNSAGSYVALLLSFT
ncbi:odorant receptor 45a-like [Sabethes cyaneus]|uniref:odorant receptor 45a-like n=1 Tax=Sabethes cyaneus TaxID=53552 RepID=UPI00237DEEDF|nr:odorant receptor 45a-like [Sabethes cyaneus]